MIMKYLWAAFAAASACAQEIASPLPPDQMIAPEDKIVLDSQAKERNLHSLFAAKSPRKIGV